MRIEIITNQENLFCVWKWMSTMSRQICAKSTLVRWSVTSTCRNPKRGAKIINRLLTPLRCIQDHIGKVYLPPSAAVDAFPEGVVYSSHRHTPQDVWDLQGTHKGLKHLPSPSRTPPKPLLGYTSVARARDGVGFFQNLSDTLVRNTRKMFEFDHFIR